MQYASDTLPAALSPSATILLEKDTDINKDIDREHVGEAVLGVI